MIVLGQTASLLGDVTRLQAIAGRSPRHIEQMTGYELGRLQGGYWIALLIERIRKGDVIFGGLTLRSGGRAGLPLSDPDADKSRKHNHDQMIDDYGAQKVGKMLGDLADDARNLKGADRIAKVVPFVRRPVRNPAKEFPPGGGAPQFTLTQDHKFFIAAEVDAKGMATTAEGWCCSVAAGAPYESRAKLYQYLLRAGL